MGKETRQSSTYFRLLSSYAVDGNVDKNWFHDSCAVTNQKSGPTWWCVNLLAPERFQTIVLYNSDSYQERLHRFSIKVSNTGGCDQSTFESSQVCYTDESSRPQDIYTVYDCKEGQFIFITVPAQKLQTICEVKIFQENLAFGKDTSQSSTYYVLSSSSNAVDGNTDGEWWNGSCTHTDFTNGPKWWCVNLRAPERFHTIRLYNRNGAKERLQGFSIKVSNTGGCDQSTFDSSQVCYTDESSTPQDIYTVYDCKEGQFIFITVPAQQTLTLCEVKILQVRERLQGFSIRVSNTGSCDESTLESCQVCYTDESSTPQDIYTVYDCKEGQFIFITVPAQQHLTLCEVKILQDLECNVTCKDGVKSSTDGLFANATVPLDTEAECNAKCSATIGCTLSMFFYGKCELFFNFAYKSINSVDACQQLCTSTPGCKTVRHTGTTCSLFKKPFDQFVADPHVSVMACLNDDDSLCM
ncbi:hypothetical protein LOTGIDRAFT_165351 [Lottia gigantea]|uniref:Fucolectin tachylectin-4 pentraxin-1 domain-containing protein n=1 Tax=Lottia gigantea TaxID=225164 RepID=V3ZC01_LOTGI|nr:hypothetical protein LOTGIDRAFT_165351 [Lottia gigantea]ESO88568.1 hypothetical protein LOTGIDRAFT_165351 [Lottia gigantea]